MAGKGAALLVCHPPALASCAADCWRLSATHRPWPGLQCQPRSSSSDVPVPPACLLPQPHQPVVFPPSPPLMQGEREWITEVSFLALLSHPNLISLVGYCAHADQRLLVYEYAPNRSLDEWLFGHDNGATLPALTWKQRLGIARGAAKGLAYLHEEAEHPVGINGEVCTS